MLEGNLRGVFYLGRCAAEDGAHSCGGHGGGGADFALAADLGTGNGGVGLDDCADGTGSEQEFPGALRGEIGGEVPAVVHHGGNDAGGAVGRGSDNAAVGGILLVDSQGVEVHPLHRVEPLGVVALLLTGQHRVHARGATADIEAAG